MIKENKKAIIWDWNGTLLNDTDLCVNCMNSLLENRRLQPLDKERYRNIFTFPVREYYRKAGFDFDEEEFEKPANEFIDLYYENLNKASLFPPVERILNLLKEKGYYQSILSAMEHERLLLSLEDKKVFSYFDSVAGINDHYAHSKLEIGQDLLKKMIFKPAEIILVGDTLHDLNVANELGVEVLLVADGHQSKQRLLAETLNVVDELSEILEFL